jgi:hypothetical protein
VFADAGFTLPATPAMAFHRGRIDLLQAHLDRDPSLLEHRFEESEIFPAELGIKPGDGLHVTPVAGGTLLHLAIEYDDIDVARWLIGRGADVNGKAALDADGFGGHTPLFHTVVTLAVPDDSKARLLLDHGADPNARATFRKQLRDMGEPEKELMREFHDVSSIGYARQFQEPRWVNGPAITAIAERAGKELLIRHALIVPVFTRSLRELDGNGSRRALRRCRPTPGVATVPPLGVHGRAVEPIAEAAADLICNQDFRLIWSRGDSTCTLVILDRTNARTRRWCNMAVCGNRAKARRTGPERAPSEDGWRVGVTA